VKQKITNKYALGYSRAAIGWAREIIRDFEVALPALTAGEVHLRSNFTATLTPSIPPCSLGKRNRLQSLSKHCIKRSKPVWLQPPARLFLKNQWEKPRGSRTCSPHLSGKIGRNFSTTGVCHEYTGHTQAGNQLKYKSFICPLNAD